MTANTTADVAPRDGVPFRRKRKARFKLARKQMRGEAAFDGGKSMLRAWFGKGLLKRRVGKKKPGARSSTFAGHKGRKYRLTKKGGGRYSIERKKG